ncbi:MAG TPA: hypothetical protein VNE58_10755 [Casimicrobiaceae bacterium]|nr:hypothetical protein [Casimicrobiaceae bacterium]
MNSDRSDRDASLDAAWSRHSTELPPPHVDAAILAAAHREARTRPRPVADDDAKDKSRGPSRTWIPLAAAATIGALAFAIVQLAPAPQQDAATITATDVPRAAESPASVAQSASPAPMTPSAPIVETPAPAPKITARNETERLPSRRQDAPAKQRDNRVAPDVPAAAPPPQSATAAPPVAAPPPPPAAPAPMIATPRPFPGAETAMQEPARDAPADTQREARQRGATAPAEKFAASPAQPRREAESSMAAASTPLAKARSPQSWIERIQLLHREQRFDEAARELAAFRHAYEDADARLPASLHGWARSIPQR